MASGKPVLAVNARALPELVKPRVNGYLFQPGSAVDAAHYMLQLLNECENWPTMGQASWTQVQSHSLNNTIRHYEDYYQAAIEKVRVHHRSVKPSRSFSHKVTS
jgi:glycosyltransferase involved in cell wall biosynthesis